MTGGGDRVRLLGHLGIERVGSTTFVHSEDAVAALTGPAHDVVGLLADGLDLDGLVAASPFGEDLVRDVLAGLESAGLTTRQSDEAHAELTSNAAATAEAAWWDACAPNRRAVPAGARVALESLDPRLDVDGTADALREVGVRVAEDATTVTDLRLVLCSDHLDPALAAVDARARRRGEPWVPVRPHGRTLWIGPFFRPAVTGCWHCLTHRLALHRRPEAVARSAAGASGPAPRPLAAHSATSALCVALLGLEISRFLRGLEGPPALLTVDTHTLDTQRHPLVRRPQCPECGDPSLLAGAPRRAVRLGDGTSGPPVDLLALVDRSTPNELVGPITGLVKALVPDRRDTAGVDVVRAGPTPVPFRPGDDLVRLRDDHGVHNAGRGRTWREAAAGAIGEAVERHSTSWQGDEDVVRCRRRDLGPAAIDPETWWLHAPVPGLLDVPATVEADDVRHWSPVTSLGDGTIRWLPTASLYFGTPFDTDLPCDSSGCAAAPTRDEAVWRGLLELVERDAVSIWWFARTSCPEVDLGPSEDLARTEHARLGRSLGALDLTTDLGVRVVAAISRREDGSGALLGFGAHPQLAPALRSAVSEVGQMLVLDAPETPDAAWRAWDAHRVRRGWTHLDPGRRPSVSPGGPGAATWPDDPTDAVRALVERLDAIGLEAFAVDMTRPDIGVPVVRVVVPGLRPSRPAFAPGRLFDVPAAMGSRARAVDVRDLDPCPPFV